MSSLAIAPANDAGETDIVAAAATFAAEMKDIDRRLRRDGGAAADERPRAAVARAFWRLAGAMDRAHAAGAASDAAIARCREEAGRWLFRSRVWNRAFHKPHGYAGDFVTIEWMYDLENDPCLNPVRPPIVNCLDHVLKTLPSVRSIWERRHWLAGLLRAEFERRNGLLRVLDVAAGGARYARDFLEQVTAGPETRLTVIDQDPAAIAFCRTRSLAAHREHVRFSAARIRDLEGAIAGEAFDVIVSAGLFDYLEDPAARALLADLAAHLLPGGSIAITNFHPADRSRLTKTWLCDWPLVYRTEAQCAALFPPGLDVTSSRSRNGALVYAVGSAV